MVLWDTCVSAEHATAGIMKGFFLPGALPEGESDKVRLRMIYTAMKVGAVFLTQMPI